MRGRSRSVGLTEREREVLAFVRLGLTNEEIAARLGITLDGAKYHVSQILAKLGVSTREEAAAVPEEEALPWWARALAWSAAAKAAVVAVMLAIVVGLGVMAWAVSTTGSGQSQGGPAGARQTPDLFATPPLPTQDPSAFAVTPCNASQVRARISYVGGGGGIDTKYFEFSNTTSRPCRLEGVPEARLVDQRGSVLSATFVADPCIAEFGDCQARLAAILDPENGPGGKASLGVQYPSSSTGCTLEDASLVLTLPDNDGDISIPFSGIPPCVQIDIGRFLPTGPLVPTPTPQS